MLVGVGLYCHLRKRGRRHVTGCNNRDDVHCPQVKTLETGEIDYEELREHLLKNKGRPAILNVNIGTTVKGAVDDLDKVRVRVGDGLMGEAGDCQAFQSIKCSKGRFGLLEGRKAVDFSLQILSILKDSGYSEDRFFIHCDGALFGMMMPFLKDAPMVTFKKPIGSVSVSGHKFVGAPVPCGVVITRFKCVSLDYLVSLEIARGMELVGEPREPWFDCFTHSCPIMNPDDAHVIPYNNSAFDKTAIHIPTL